MSGLSNPLRGARRAGFTLTELLVVVVILAILVAVAIPMFNQSSLEAQEATLRHDLSVYRSAVERYRAQHLGVYPGYPPGGGPPSSDEFRWQLVKASKPDGSTGSVKNPDYPLGPYVGKPRPENPINGKKSFLIVADGAPFPAPDDSTGYIFKPETGQLRANLTGTSSEGEAYFDF